MEMESVRDPNVDPTNRRQVWEATSQYLLHCRPEPQAYELPTNSV